MKKIIIGITGASGSIHGLRLVQALLAGDVEIHLIISDMGVQVLSHELKIEKDDVPGFFMKLQETGRPGGRIIMHWSRDMFAPVASGSFLADAMVVAPCSMKTLSAIANGYTTNLLERAADVMLKERRPLILMTRETPLNRVHLSNMLRAHDAGAVIMPASPGYYHHPETMEDLVAFMVARVLDHLHIGHAVPMRWGEDG
jgi:4-hydroxy-3-polyprenylbenzoate decarboxylase